MRRMTRIWRWLRAVGCPHTSRYRERRDVAAVPVLHLVCAACGDAVPALTETPEAQAQLVAAGRAVVPTARVVTAAERRRKAGTNVIRMRGRR